MSRELDIIQCISQLANQPEDLADDAYWDAELRQIVTTDMLVEGHHFSLDYFSPEDLGWKAAAVNISDIAGMGGVPTSLLISLGLPQHINVSWIQDFYKGLLAACEQYGARLVGGDTVSSEHLILNVTALGHCPIDSTVGRRPQAQAGDWVIATGYHGLSRVGLEALQTKSTLYPASSSAHLRPQPRITEGLLLSKRFSRYALMDSSDGLADALIKIANASQKTVVANSAKIPLHPEVKGYAQAKGFNPLDVALYGGEDFQLVATVPELPPDLLAHFHVIGRVEEATETPNALLEIPGQPERVPLDIEKTYQHFGASHE